MLILLFAGIQATHMNVGIILEHKQQLLNNPQLMAVGSLVYKAKKPQSIPRQKRGEVDYLVIRL